MLTRNKSKLKITVKQLFQAGEIWPVVVVDSSTGRIIALQEVNETALRRTLKTGRCHYWDRVNRVVYLKGEHSGEIESLKELRLDICHARRHLRSLLFEVSVADGSCKFGMTRCQFYRFDGRFFVLDDECRADESAVREHWGRINTLLNEDEEILHQKRYVKKK